MCLAATGRPPERGELYRADGRKLNSILGSAPALMGTKTTL